MKLVDSNIWLALALSGHDFHNAAHDWLRAETAASDVLFCRSTQQALLRLLTTSAVLGRFGNDPLTNAQAWGVYQGFLDDPRIVFVHEPPGLEPSWQRLAIRDSASPKVWMDSYLAAFAISGYLVKERRREMSAARNRNSRFFREQGAPAPIA